MIIEQRKKRAGHKRRKRPSILEVVPKYKLSTLFLIMLLCAIVAWIVAGSGGQIAYDAPRDAVWLRLPADASHIHYYHPGAFGSHSYCEFDTSEESFLAWVKTITRALPSPTQPPFVVGRYHAYGHDASAEHDVSIDEGHYYRWIAGDRGEHIAYDKTTGRAYYHYHSR